MNNVKRSHQKKITAEIEQRLIALPFQSVTQTFVPPKTCATVHPLCFHSRPAFLNPISVKSAPDACFIVNKVKK